MVIKIVVGSISDVKVSRLGEQYMYRWLFRNKMEVYEYQDTILHGKLATYDGIWMTDGSYNVNRISAYSAFRRAQYGRADQRLPAKVEEELEGRSSGISANASYRRNIFNTSDLSNVSDNGWLTR